MNLWWKSGSHSHLLPLHWAFSLTWAAALFLIEPKLWGLQVVIIIHEFTQTQYENYSFKRGLALLFEFTVAILLQRLTFRHNHHESFHFFKSEVHIETFTLKRTRLRKSTVWVFVAYVQNLKLWYWPIIILVVMSQFEITECTMSKRRHKQNKAKTTSSTNWLSPLRSGSSLEETEIGGQNQCQKNRKRVMLLLKYRK